MWQNSSFSMPHYSSNINAPWLLSVIVSYRLLPIALYCIHTKWNYTKSSVSLLLSYVLHIYCLLLFLLLLCVTHSCFHCSEIDCDCWTSWNKQTYQRIWTVVSVSRISCTCWISYGRLVVWPCVYITWLTRYLSRLVKLRTSAKSAVFDAFPLSTSVGIHSRQRNCTTKTYYLNKRCLYRSGIFASSEPNQKVNRTEPNQLLLLFQFVLLSICIVLKSIVIITKKYSNYQIVIDNCYSCSLLLYLMAGVHMVFKTLSETVHIEPTPFTVGVDILYRWPFTSKSITVQVSLWNSTTVLSY